MMGCISPGGTELMASAIGRLNLAKSSRILEVGCGEGDTLSRIAADYGFDCIGIDKSKELLQRGRKKYPALDLRPANESDTSKEPVQCGRKKYTALDLRVANESDTSPNNGEINSPYADTQPFDTIIMECVLSVSGDPEKTLQSYANALKPKGYLLISDLCERDQKPDALIESAQKLDLQILSLEDRTADLDSFAMEKIMEYGSLKKYYESALPSGSQYCNFFPTYGATNGNKNKAQGRAPGYFLAVFQANNYSTKPTE